MIVLPITMHDSDFELIIFGPGYGEAILIHLGNDEWIVVDSCLNPVTKRPAVIEYLENQGINPANIKLIAATHWHDDHIRGLHDIVSICPNAKFVISEALNQKEFIKLVSLYSNPLLIESESGLSEFSNIFKFLHFKNKKPMRAIANRILYQKTSEGLNCTISSLSPSDAAILLSNLQMKDLIPSERSDKRRIPTIKPNNSSIVIWINVNNRCILLGSDLEDSTSDEIGWKAILLSDIISEHKAEVFKVPHHGSGTSDNDEIWNKLLIDQPVAILTPFKNGKIILPMYKDLIRINSKSQNSFLTSPNKIQRSKVHKRYLDIEMSIATKSRTAVNPYFGYIKLKTSMNGQNKWDIEMYGDAVKISDLIKGYAISKKKKI